MIVPALAGGAFTWLGQSGVAFFKSRSHRTVRAQSEQEQTERHALTEANAIERHRDQLTFDLLTAAREEVAAARKEAIDLRNLQARLHFFDEALDHVVALLRASEDKDTSGIAERHARVFLTRITRDEHYQGDLQNGPGQVF